MHLRQQMESMVLLHRHTVGITLNTPVGSQSRLKGCSRGRRGCLRVHSVEVLGATSTVVAHVYLSCLNNLSVVADTVITLPDTTALSVAVCAARL